MYLISVMDDLNFQYSKYSETASLKYTLWKEKQLIRSCIFIKEHLKLKLHNTNWSFRFISLR